MTEYNVIDVSHWNGSINFNTVKNSGIWGVIINPASLPRMEPQTRIAL